MKRGPYIGRRSKKKRVDAYRKATIRQIEADIAMMERALKNARALRRALLSIKGR